jgi:hypothetical protein
MNCEECIWTSEETGSCMNSKVDDVGEENCSGFEQKTPQLEPEDMFKVLYMLIYELGGEISISRESLGKVTEAMKILPSYDAETKRFVLETSFKPPKIKRKRGIVVLKKKVITP